MTVGVPTNPAILERDVGVIARRQLALEAAFQQLSSHVAALTQAFEIVVSQLPKSGPVLPEPPLQELVPENAINGQPSSFSASLQLPPERN